MKKYSHLFFDLDNTLWDFDTNCSEALRELYLTFELSQLYMDFGDFVTRFKLNNYSMWADYKTEPQGASTITHNLSDSQFINHFNAEFEKLLVTKTNLLPNAIEVLTYLQRKYHLYIITNGRQKVQTKKLENSHLQPFFKKIFISEQIGLKKPERAFFEFVVKSSNAKKSACLVIGDSLANDINGSKAFGIDSIYFNNFNNEQSEVAMTTISNLNQLLQLL